MVQIPPDVNAFHACSLENPWDAEGSDVSAEFINGGIRGYHISLSGECAH